MLHDELGILLYVRHVAHVEIVDLFGCRSVGYRFFHVGLSYDVKMRPEGFGAIWGWWDGEISVAM